MEIKINIYLLIIVSVFLFSAAASAQEVKELTIDEAISTGLENSYGLHSSRMQITASEARVNEINGNRLPSLALNASYTRLSSIDPLSLQTPLGNFRVTEDIVNAYYLKLTLQQPIFTGFKLMNSSRIAMFNYQAAKQDFTAEEKKQIYNIKNAYWALYKAGEVKKVVDENVEQVKAHLDDIQNLFKQGLATKNELLRVQVQLSEAELRQIDANNAVRLTTVNLNNIMNVSLTNRWLLKTNVQPRQDVIQDLDVLTEKAYNNRPELKAMDYRVQASEKAIDIAKSSWWPQVVLQGNYVYANPNQRVFPQTDEFKGTWDITVGLQMNIWNWGQTSNQTTQAEAQYEQVKDSYASLKDAVELELTQTYLNVLRAKERIFVAEGSVGQAEENFRVTSEKFKNGLVLNTDLIDAEVDLLQARTNYVQSLVDYELAKASLERSIGE